jgi:hypothetical protein
MTITVRANNFDIDRPPLEFGVRWDPSKSDPVAALTRLGDATSLSVDTSTSPHVSDFSNYYPWKGIERCNLNINGDIMAVHGDSNFNETTVTVASRLPYFFYKIVLDPNGATNIRDYWLSPYPLKGYRIHPAFLRWNYTGVTKRITNIFVGSYEAIVTRPGSVAGVAPQVSYSRPSFRTAIGGIGGGFSSIDWQTWNALQWLYLIEYASLDFQTPSGSRARGGLSKGLTNAAALEYTGWTSSVDVNQHGRHSVDLGNASGQVQCNVNGSAPVFASSFHGVENLVGNTWTILDGVNIGASGAIWFATGSYYVDQALGSFGSPYQFSGIYAPGTTSTWLRGPSWYYVPNFGNDWMFGSHNWDVGGSSSTGVCDYYNAAADWSVPRIPLVGGGFSQVWQAGPWALNCALGYSGTAADVGARLVQVPLDIDFWRY